LRGRRRRSPPCRRPRRPSAPERLRRGPRRRGPRASRQLEHHLVDVAPAPALTGLDRAGDRVVALVGVAARVPVRRGVAAPDRAARLAHAEMEPPVARLQALLAAEDGGRWFDDHDLVEMSATRHSGITVAIRLRATAARTREPPTGSCRSVLLLRRALLDAPLLERLLRRLLGHLLRLLRTLHDRSPPLRGTVHSRTQDGRRFR
jgi:hypothetical protein